MHRILSFCEVSTFAPTTTIFCNVRSHVSRAVHFISFSNSINLDNVVSTVLFMIGHCSSSLPSFLLSCPIQVKNNRFESMGDDGGYTGTRNGRCSLPSSSRLGDDGLLCSGRGNKELLICQFLVVNNRLKSIGYDGGYSLTIEIVEEATVLISVIVVGTFHCKFIMFYIDLFFSINNDFHSFFCFKHII